MSVPRRVKQCWPIKGRHKKLHYLSGFQTVPVLCVCFLFLHNKHMTGPDMYINRQESVCNCSAESPRVTISDFPQKDKREAFPQLFSKAFCISLGKIAQRFITASASGSPQGCLLSLQANARDLQCLQSGSKMALVLECRISSYQSSGIRNCQEQWQGPPKPFVLSGICVALESASEITE